MVRFLLIGSLFIANVLINGAAVPEYESIEFEVYGHRGFNGFSNLCEKQKDLDSAGLGVFQGVEVGQNKNRSKKKIGCDSCGKQFFAKTHLKAHIRTHTGEKPFNCDVCNKKFKQRSSLIVHMRIHTREEPFECVFCKKKFKYQNSSNRHSENYCKKNKFRQKEKQKKRKCDDAGGVESKKKQKNYQCLGCGKKFASNCHLKDHLTVHTGEKLFVCQDQSCNKSFATYGYLKKHVARMHAKEKIFLFQN